MKNPDLKISKQWKVLRDDFRKIDLTSTDIDVIINPQNLSLPGDLFWINNGVYSMDLKWLGENEIGSYQLCLFRGEDLYNCELLEKIQTRDFNFLISILNNIVRNVDDKFYDNINVPVVSIDEFSEVELVSKFQISHTIIKCENKIEALRFYLASNKFDTEGDSWISGHNPNIIEHLNGFTEKEFQILNKESENWADDVIVNLANPVFECSNPKVQGNYLYCKIFLQIKIFDDLEYLIENLSAIASNINNSQELVFYKQLLEKAKKVNNRSQGNYDYAIIQLEEICKARNVNRN